MNAPLFPVFPARSATGDPRLGDQLADRVVLDNTTIAVKQVLTGRDRVQTDAFQAFRGAYPFAAAFLFAGEGLGEGLGRDGRHVCAQSRVPAAAYSRELGRAQRVDHH